MITKLIPVLAFVVALLTFFLYVEPTWSGSIATARASIAGDNAALAAAAQYTAKQNELISAEKQINPDALARLSEFLPDSVDNVGLILNLDALAAKDGLSLTTINVAQQPLATAPDPSAPTATPYNSVNLTLTATGSYDAFHTFLTSVEKSARLLDVRSLAVTGSDTGVYTYNMTLRLYWLQ